MDDELIEKLQVAKGYVQNIVGYSRRDGQKVPVFGVVSSKEKRQAMAIIKAYYRGESIRPLPLCY